MGGASPPPPTPRGEGRPREPMPPSPISSCTSLRLFFHLIAIKMKRRKNAAAATPPTTPPTICFSCWVRLTPPLPPPLLLPALESPAAVEVEAGLSPPPPFPPRPTPVPVPVGYDDHSESEDDQDSVKLEIVDSELVDVEEVGVEENESTVKDSVGVLAGVVGLDVEEELLEIGVLVAFCEGREVEMLDSEGIEADTIGRPVPDVVGARDCVSPNDVAEAVAESGEAVASECTEVVVGYGALSLAPGTVPGTAVPEEPGAEMTAVSPAGESVVPESADG